jgi:ankyrin repeat protein
MFDFYVENKYNNNELGAYCHQKDIPNDNIRCPVDLYFYFRPINTTMENDNADEFSQLVKYKLIDVNKPNQLGLTIVHELAARNCKNILSLLQENHEELLEAIEWRGWTPLHSAAEKGSLDVAKVLLRYSKSTLPDSNSPLLVALRSKRREVAELLIRNGNIELESFDNIYGYSPIHYLIVNRWNDLLKDVIKKHPRLAILTKSYESSKIEKVQECMKTRLWKRDFLGGYFQNVKWLQEDEPHMIRFLSPLMAAIIAHNDEAIEIILNSNPDYDFPEEDNMQRNAWDISVDMKYQEIWKRILQSDARVETPPSFTEYNQEVLELYLQKRPDAVKRALVCLCSDECVSGVNYILENHQVENADLDYVITSVVYAEFARREKSKIATNRLIPILDRLLRHKKASCETGVSSILFLAVSAPTIATFDLTFKYVDIAADEGLASIYIEHNEDSDEYTSTPLVAIFENRQDNLESNLVADYILTTLAPLASNEVLSYREYEIVTLSIERRLDNAIIAIASQASDVYMSWHQCNQRRALRSLKPGTILSLFSIAAADKLDLLTQCIVAGRSDVVLELGRQESFRKVVCNADIADLLGTAYKYQQKEVVTLLLDMVPPSDDSLGDSFSSSGMQYLLASDRSDILELLLTKLAKDKLWDHLNLEGGNNAIGVYHAIASKTNLEPSNNRKESKVAKFLWNTFGRKFLNTTLPSKETDILAQLALGGQRDLILQVLSAIGESQVSNRLKKKDEFNFDVVDHAHIFGQVELYSELLTRVCRNLLEKDEYMSGEDRISDLFHFRTLMASATTIVHNPRYTMFINCGYPLNSRDYRIFYSSLVANGDLEIMEKVLSKNFERSIAIDVFQEQINLIRSIKTTRFDKALHRLLQEIQKAADWADKVDYPGIVTDLVEGGCSTTLEELLKYDRFKQRADKNVENYLAPLHSAMLLKHSAIYKMLYQILKTPVSTEEKTPVLITEDITYKRRTKKEAEPRMYYEDLARYQYDEDGNAVDMVEGLSKRNFEEYRWVENEDCLRAITATK